MKKLVILILIMFSLFLGEANAGLVKYSGVVHLKPFSSEKFCGIALYATTKINGTYTLGYSDNIMPFVRSISPETVDLTSIDFYNPPSEGKARREWVKKTCNENNTDSCVMTCTDFQGLGLKRISFALAGPVEEEIIGQVYDIVEIRGSRGKEVLQFIVVYTPFDGRIIIGIMFLIITIIGTIFIYKKRKKPPDESEYYQPDFEMPLRGNRPNVI